ncbi:MAG: hypothetical protein ACXU9L_03920 [Thermodesulfobacteriota bacterium]
MTRGSGLTLSGLLCPASERRGDALDPSSGRGGSAEWVNSLLQRKLYEGEEVIFPAVADKEKVGVDDNEQFLTIPHNLVRKLAISNYNDRFDFRDHIQQKKFTGILNEA